jgi:thiol peroxidase
MGERSGLVTFEGNALTLIGSEVELGDEGPDFSGLARDLSEVQLSDFRGKVVLIASVPSLDTRVCDTEARRFNEEAVQLGEDVRVLVISMDLPFAQKRWCAAAGIENLQTLSDHRDASFGRSYGVLIRDLRLLARSIWVVDRGGKIRYVELVNELTDHPDYDAALAVVREVVNE